MKLPNINSFLWVLFILKVEFKCLIMSYSEVKGCTGPNKIKKILD